MSPPLTAKHHALIQSLLSRGPMPEATFHSLFSAATGKNPAVYRDLFNEYLLRINMNLEYVQFEVRGCRNQYDGTVFYGVVNNASDESAKMGTRYSGVQVAFFKAVAEMIIHDVTNHGFISNIEALNIRLENQVLTGQGSEDGTPRIPYALKNFTMSQKEKTLNGLVEDQWLCYTSKGNIGLGVRSFLDLRRWFHSNKIPSCDVCNEAGIKAYACPKSGCSVRMHKYCLEKKFPQGKVGRVCPRCSTSWALSEVDGEEESNNPASQKRARRYNAQPVDTGSLNFTTKRKRTTKAAATPARGTRNCKAKTVDPFLSQTEAPWGAVPRKARCCNVEHDASGDGPSTSMPSKKRRFKRMRLMQPRTLKASWIYEREVVFINILIARVKNKIGTHSFSKETWKEIKSEFSKQSNMSYSVVQLKSKYYKLKQKHKKFQTLIRQSGFHWHPSTCTVTANYAVWDDYIKANQHAKTFKAKGCPEYHKLCIIFGDTITKRERPRPISTPKKRAKSTPGQGNAIRRSSRRSLDFSDSTQIL